MWRGFFLRCFCSQALGFDAPALSPRLTTSSGQDFIVQLAYQWIFGPIVQSVLDSCPMTCVFFTVFAVAATHSLGQGLFPCVLFARVCVAEFFVLRPILGPSVLPVDRVLPCIVDPALDSWDLDKDRYLCCQWNL